MRRTTDRAEGCCTSRTTAVRHPPLGARRSPSGPSISGTSVTTFSVTALSVTARSVTLVPLLEPGVAAVVVAVGSPEARLIVVEEGQARAPFRALPEVEMRHEQTYRPAVVDRQGPPLVLPDDPGLAVGDVRQRQVGRVA